MSAGHVHTKASLLLTGGFLLSAVITKDINGVYHAVGSLIGVMITPDCDVDNGFSADRYIRKGIGKVAGKGVGLFVEKIWDGLWYFYRKSLKHGQELSHFPGLGTTGRIEYLYLMLIVLPHIAYYVLFSPGWSLWHVLNWYHGEIWGQWRIILGLMGADTIHYVLDQVDLLIRDFEIKTGLRKLKSRSR